MAGIEGYSVTPGSNNSASPAGWPEGMAPSGVNDSDRAFAAAVRAEWAVTSLTASATMSIGTSAAGVGAYIHVCTDSNKSISSFDTIAAGIRRTLIFDVPATLVYDATKLIIPGARSVSLSAGQAVQVMSEGGGNWRVINLETGLDPVVFNTPVRQTVLSGSVDSSGYASAISAGAALNFNVAATTTNMVLSFAGGHSAAGAVDLIAALTADASNQGALAASNTNYLHATYVSPSSVTWGNGLVPPQYGYAFDKSQAALLNFEGTNGATTTTDDFGNSWTITTGAISTAQKKFGSSSLDCSGGSTKYIKSTGITSLGDGSWEIQLWFYLTALPANNTDSFLVDFVNAAALGARLTINNTAGTVKLLWALSSNGSTADITSGVVGTNTTWTLSQWNRIRFQFDALAGAYRVFLSLNGAAETLDATFSSSARICNFAGGMFCNNQAAPATNQQLYGFIDGARVLRCATNTSTETPSAVAPTITDYPVHWFDIPAMVMRDATTASASAGTNPTFTARNRVFVGEQDTNATVVTATRNYALRGQYISADTAIPAAGVRTSFSHNLGLSTGVKLTAFGRGIASAAGMAQGNVIPLLANSSASAVAMDPTGSTTKNNGYIQAGDQASSFVYLRDTGVEGSFPTAQGKMFLTAKREW